MIKNAEEVKSYFFKILEANGNRFLREETNPRESGRLYIFQNRLLISSEQMKELKQYLFQIRPERETEFCFFSTGNQNKEKVIWEGSSTYQTYLKQKIKREEQQNNFDEKEKIIQREIQEIKLQMLLGKIKSFFQFESSRNKIAPYPREVSIPFATLPEFKGEDEASKVDTFLNLLKTHGVQILHSQEQPDGVRAIYLDRQVKIPICLQNFLVSKSALGLQPKDCGSRKLIHFKTVSVAYTMISVSDENFYYRKKLGY